MPDRAKHRVPTGVVVSGREPELRLLSTLLLIVVISAGASFVTRATKFDDIEEQLREATEQLDNIGSDARRPQTPVVIPEATPGWGPFGEADTVH